MIIQPEQIKQFVHILSVTSGILEHQKEREILLGEKFNIFSILKVERKENATHSAFLSELLKPNGSHLKGSIFLSLFLKVIGDETIDINSVKVKTEHVIGKVDRENETGGRIDIFIFDIHGVSISIENKIDANDQLAQIKRYYKFNKSKNTVFYLTKMGVSPTDKSKGGLVVGQDFHNISYKTEIIEWLQLCLKECFDTPVLRETIKQYLIVVKKITNTMENKGQNELSDLILKNLKESSFIASNYEKTIQDFRVLIRREVFNQLMAKISNNYIIEKGNKISDYYAQIWIKPMQIKDSSHYFGVESFNGRGNFGGQLFVGVFFRDASKTFESSYLSKNSFETYSHWWPFIHKLEDFEDCEMNLGNIDTMVKLSTDKRKFEGFINNIVSQIEDFLNKETAPLIAYIENEKK
jgi:hypothetical protein